MITRVFRGRTLPGKAAEFEGFIRTQAIPEFESNPGILAVHFGTPTEQSPDEFLVVTVWKDVDALRAYAGEDWGAPKLTLAEAHLLEWATVHHYRNGDGEPIGLGQARGDGAPSPDIVQAGGLRVNLATRSIEVEGRRVELPPREFALLAELALRAGRPIPSDELARLAWPDTSWPTGDDVRRTVYRLRRLIGDNERPRPLIRNRRGFGYVLEA